MRPFLSAADDNNNLTPSDDNSVIVISDSDLSFGDLGVGILSENVKLEVVTPGLDIITFIVLFVNYSSASNQFLLADDSNGENEFNFGQFADECHGMKITVSTNYVTIINISVILFVLLTDKNSGVGQETFYNNVASASTPSERPATATVTSDSPLRKKTKSKASSGMMFRS